MWSEQASLKNEINRRTELTTLQNQKKFTQALWRISHRRTFNLNSQGTCARNMYSNTESVAQSHT